MESSGDFLKVRVEELWEVWRSLEDLSGSIARELDSMQMPLQEGSLIADARIWRYATSMLIPRSVTTVGLATLLASAILPRPISYIFLYPCFRLVFGTLFPAYASYKAVRTKDVKEYVKWMMYWIVFALFTCAETFTDIFLSFWFPFYYELKIILVIYLLSPATKGSSILYRKFVHPALTKHEQEIDEYIARAKEQGYHTVLTLGSKGVNYATSILMQTAIKGGGGLVNQIRKSYSLTDLPGEHEQRRKTQSRDELDDTYPESDVRLVRRKRGTSPRRTVSSGSQVDLFFAEVDVRDEVSDNFQPSHIRSSEDITCGYSSSDTSAVRPEVKEGLVRTSSVSRVRTRASVKADRPALSEDLKDPSEAPVDESQNDSDSLHLPTPNPEPPVGGNVLSPFVRPHLQYLFSNLSEAELLALVTSATAPVKPVEVSIIEQNSNPSAILNSLIACETMKPKECATLSDNELLKENPLESESVIPGSTNTLDDPGSSNLPELPLDDKKPLSSNLTDEKSELNRVIRRTKKRQAPVPPMGGSLIDLNRLSEISQLSDQIEVNSVLDFETDFATPDSSPSRSNTSLQENKMKRKNLTESKSFLQFPKFSFWQKPKHCDEVAQDFPVNSSMRVSDIHDSFISLHEDLSTNPSQSSVLPSSNVREMSQSPSSKRRSGKF